MCIAELSSEILIMCLNIKLANKTMIWLADIQN